MSRRSGPHSRTTRRLAARILGTALALLAMLVPTAFPAGADPSDQLDEVEDRLGDAREDLHDVDAETAREQEELEQVQARQAELDDELTALNGELSQAESELATAESRLEQTTVELTATQGRLDDARADLASYRKRFARRARETYMYGGSAALSTFSLADMESLSDFGHAMKYARVLLEADQRDIETVEALERNIERDTRDLVALQAEQAERQADAQRERDSVAAIVDERQAVADAAAEQAQRHEAILARLNEKKQQYVAMVADLEAQSVQLEEELRQIALAEERRRARAAARAAARREAAEREAAAAAAERNDPAPKPPDDPPADSGSSEFLWPASGPKTSDYGWRVHPIFGTSRFHAGIDIGAGYGAQIWAATDGVVHSAGPMGGYGNAVVVDHGGGLATLYAHQSSIAVSPGQSVSRGQVIGYVGSTGYSTGPHLHFEVRVNGSPQDPMSWF